MVAIFPLKAGLLVLSALLLSTTASTARSVIKKMDLPQPPGLKSSLGAASGMKAAAQLKSLVSDYLRGQYRINGEQYYKINKVMGWAQFSKLFAIEMKTRGMSTTRPQLMPWHRGGGIDLIELYPHGERMLAVAMAKEPLADGAKLVGFFDVVAVGK